MMKLPQCWEIFLADYLDFKQFYSELHMLIRQSEIIIPYPEKVFSVFQYMKPEQVHVVLYGEDPYPRCSSANGVAFWDAEIKSWRDKTNGNSLKNILKALLVAKRLASYQTPIAQCRTIAEQVQFLSPPQLFNLWLDQGILLVNTALTFAGTAEKRKHFAFWKPFHQALISALNNRSKAPFYILWGKKAQKWESVISQSANISEKIIKQGHPTFIHQFLDRDNPDYSPFIEIELKTGLKWC